MKWVKIFLIILAILVILWFIFDGGYINRNRTRPKASDTIVHHKGEDEVESYISEYVAAENSNYDR